MMKPTFLRSEPYLTVMLQCETPEEAAAMIRRATAAGAEAFGLQAEYLKPEYRTTETYRALFSGDKPFYVTNYRARNNLGKSDDELAEGLLLLAEGGATLCDVMGDMFCKHPEELTDDAAAIERQRRLIDELHARGAEVLMSSHVYTFTPAERVLEIALEQKRRGADIIKIVTGADTMEQQLENLKITHLLKRELGAPFLFLSGGECALHRRLGIHLGCCMALCVDEYTEFSTPTQPLLEQMRQLKNAGI